MTNLIPPEAKKHLVRLYRIRLVSAWALMWSVALFVGALLMWPTYLLISGTSNAYSASVASAELRTEAYDEMVGQLNNTGLEAKRIIQNSQEPQFSNMLKDIWEINGQGVAISGVNIGREAKKISPIILNGEATDRQALASFRDRIEALDYVVSVNLPIENLAQNQDIIFTITVTVNSSQL